MDKQKAINFFAMLDRMKYIERWSLMKNTERENLKEHSFDVILLVHALVEIRKAYFPDQKPRLDPGQAVLFALYHDTSEIITGDLPTPVKYFNSELRQQYGLVEEYAEDFLLSLLPDELEPGYRKFFKQDKLSETEAELKRFVKYADTLAAYIKCIRELKLGNKEFTEAAQSTYQKLLNYQSPELDFFMANILPAYQLSLDQLQSPL